MAESTNSQNPAEASPSEWFLLGRIRGVRWPTEAPLPLAFLYFHLALATLAVLALVVAAVRTPTSTSIVLPFLQLAYTIFLLLAIAVHRPWGWHYILVSQYSLLLLGLLERPASDRTSLLLAELVYGALLLLYLARRRAQFGLDPWPFVM